MKHEPGFLAIVNDSKKRIHETNVSEVRKKMERGDSFYLVDVREDREWDENHLPHAIHLGKGIIERDIEKTIPDPGAEIILYCGGGYRSALVADNLQKMGYKNVWSMDGGFKGWVNAGYPLAKK
jgi:rhodanese-related sulfurtransferase